MDIIHLGQHLCKDVVNEQLITNLNKRIDDLLDKNEQVDYTKLLSAKIKTEYDVANILKEIDTSQEIPGLIEKADATFYNDTAFKWNVKFHSAWGNDQKEGEYQVVHTHSGNSSLGYSLILFLKVPDFGPEYTNTVRPLNGRTVLFNNGGGQSSNKTFIIEPNIGDIYIFPYDMQHIVYPFIGDGVRRTISCNFDLIGIK